MLRLALVLAVAATAQAQQPQPASGLAGYFAAGASHISTGNLDERLAANGHPTFGSTSPGFSVGAYRLLRSGVMLGGEWHFLPVGRDTHQGREVGLGAGYATIGVGYAKQLTGRACVYPRLGVGVGGMGLWSEDVSQSGNAGFDQWVANPESDPKYTTLSQGSMVVDLGGGAELPLTARGSGPLVGLRFGYIATAFDQGWTRDGREVSGSPRATVAGPYVRLVLGWRRDRPRQSALESPHNVTP